MEALGLQAGSIKQLVYGANVRRDLKLLEVDEKLLESIQKGNVSFKADCASGAVLCTDAATFALKHVETTNSVFLAYKQLQAEEKSTDTRASAGSELGVPDVRNKGLLTQLGQEQNADRQPLAIVAATGSHIEIVRTAPQFGRLDDLLRACVCNPSDRLADDAMEVDQPAAYSTEELLNACQASEAELLAALRERNAVKIDHRWRVVEPDHLTSLRHLVLLSAQEKDWDLGAIPVGEAVSALAEIGCPIELAMHCLETLSWPFHEQQPEAVALKETKVCLLIAELLFKEQSRWPLPTFLKEWQDRVPQGMRISRDLLRGEVLVEKEGPSEFVRFFSARQLSKDPADRFAQLFALQPRWQETDLLPFLRGMLTPSQSVEALLLKFCRATQSCSDGSKQYSSR